MSTGPSDPTPARRLAAAVTRVAGPHPAAAALTDLINGMYGPEDPNTVHGLTDAIAIATGHLLIHRDLDLASGIEDAAGVYVQWFLKGRGAHVEISGGDVPRPILPHLAQVAAEGEYGWVLHGVNVGDVARIIPKVLGAGPYRLFPNTLTADDVSVARLALPLAPPPPVGPPETVTDTTLLADRILEALGSPRALAAIDSGQMTVRPATGPDLEGVVLGPPRTDFAVRVGSLAAAMAVRRAIAIHNLELYRQFGVILGGIGPRPFGDASDMLAGVTMFSGRSADTVVPLVRAISGDGYWMVTEDLQRRASELEPDSEMGRWWPAMVLRAVEEADIVQRFLTDAPLLDVDTSGVRWGYTGALQGQQVIAATVPGLADRTAPLTNGSVLAQTSAVEVAAVHRGSHSNILEMADGTSVEVPGYQTVAVLP